MEEEKKNSVEQTEEVNNVTETSKTETAEASAGTNTAEKKTTGKKKKPALSKSARRRYGGHKRYWLRVFRRFVILVIVFFLIFRFVLGISRVEGDSMMPTIANNEYALYLRVTETYRVGDILSIRTPGDEYYIKRVVAVAGDTVDIRDGILYVNGVAENNRKAVGNTEVQEGFSDYPCTLTEGQIFVLGDNRETSIDSRTYGPMSLSQVRGRILCHTALTTK